ncbi:MAG: ZIP family metal transporter [Oscillospiraceae bacterium]|nr:ZIP family metal transporter [Oscillospiraceae bacterium]
MKVFLIAFSVGGATMLGGILGYLIKYNNKKFDGVIFSFAAGIMMAASFSELILPCADENYFMFFLCLLGIIGGGGLIVMLQQLIPLIEKRILRRGMSLSDAQASSRTGVLLFVAAIAIHNLPEGAAAGVGLGTGDMAKAVTVAAGIALQNIPEGMIVIPPLTRAGFSRRNALYLSVFTGVIEIFGTYLGYLTSSVAGKIMPLILCVAGGTMLYVICTDLIDEACSLAGKKASGFSFLAGCCIMLIMEKII